LTHRQAVLVMIGVAMLWSIAGVVTRHLEAARGFEMTFWRSAANTVALVLLLSWLRGPGPLWRSLRNASVTLWWSGLCWCVMFTAFMMALNFTTVANVLVTMSVAPLFTALVAWAVLKHRLAARTWAAIVLAGIGIAWMYGAQFQAGDARHWLGTAVALGVPIAAAANWTLLQHDRTRRSAGGEGTDFMPAVLIGALMSAAITLPLALPFQATGRDLALLSMLGVVQLAIPCLISVAVARVLPAPEIALLALLEVVAGVAWAWLGAGEAPSAAVLGGGTLVLLALAGNEALGLHAGRVTSR
jgi:drug/metabolite transporter (DMT)-like permease